MRPLRMHTNHNWILRWSWSWMIEGELDSNLLLLEDCNCNFTKWFLDNMEIRFWLQFMRFVSCQLVKPQIRGSRAPVQLLHQTDAYFPIYGLEGVGCVSDAAVVEAVVKWRCRCEASSQTSQRFTYYPPVNPNTIFGFWLGIIYCVNVGDWDENWDRLKRRHLLPAAHLIPNAFETMSATGRFTFHSWVIPIFSILGWLALKHKTSLSSSFHRSVFYCWLEGKMKWRGRGDESEGIRPTSRAQGGMHNSQSVSKR